LTGLNTRLKSYESLLRKINKDGLHHSYGDVLRYTLLADAKDYAEKANLVMEDMKRIGYKTIEVRDYWVDKDTAYNGLNINFATPDRYIFELQFQTPESLELKNRLHPIYEKLRKSNDELEITRLGQIMDSIAEGYTTVPNARDIR
jgi:hypothetical protein